MEREKKFRAPNYSLAEKESLLRLVASQKHIIENKKTDSSSMEEKKLAWEKVAREFNSMAPGMAQRSLDSLKKFYNNQKEELRKRLANEKKTIYCTGGGPPPPPPERDAADKILISIVSEKTLYGIKDSIAPYDDDYLDKDYEQTTNTPISLGKTSDKVETVNSCDSDPFRGPSMSMLKAPINEALKQNINKVQDTQTQNNIQILVQDDKEDSVELIPSQEESNRTSLKRPLNSQFICKNEKRKILPSKSRRRPTIVKTLTTSKLGERYETLIEKKLELLEGLKKEHQLRIDILELEKKIKEEQLKKIMQGDISAIPRVLTTVQGSDVDNAIGESVDWTL